VDGQRTLKVARGVLNEGGRVKKKEAPHFVPGDVLLRFLEAKVRSAIP